PAAVGVGEHVVGLAQPTHLRRPLRRLDVVEAELLVIRGADLVVGRLGWHPEDGVQVAHVGLLARLCSRRQLLIRAWSPETSPSGTDQPRNSAGRVYCGNSAPPSSSAENVSNRGDASARAPGCSLAIASTSTIAGSSPPERTYGPIEMASEQRWVRIRSSKPSKRAESSVRHSSPA